MLANLKIIGGCIFGAILFGISHDLATAHCFPPYFTHFHPKLIDSESPLAMALLWGVIATWWVGLFAGVVLSFCSQVGSKPKLTAKAVLNRVSLSLFIVYILSMALLLTHIYLLRNEDVGSILPEEFNFNPRFFAVLQVHNFSYGAAFLAIVFQAVSLVKMRWSNKVPV